MTTDSQQACELCDTPLRTELIDLHTDQPTDDGTPHDRTVLMSYCPNNVCAQLPTFIEDTES